MMKNVNKWFRIMLGHHHTLIVTSSCTQIYAYKVCTDLRIQSVHRFTHTKCAQIYAYKVCTDLRIQSVHRFTHTKCAQIYAYKVCTDLCIQSVHRLTHTKCAPIDPLQQNPHQMKQCPNMQCEKN